ncbi:MAG: hypothetical protein ABEJ60_06950 [Halodesulfurarchaeum sp.]
MRVRVGDEVHVGQALDLRTAEIGPDRLQRAIADPGAELVTATRPTPLHEHVGRIESGMALDCRMALVAAGRSIGLEAPQAAAIPALDRRIAAIDPATPDLRAARRRVAEVGEEVARLEEQVARTSGRLNARREAGLRTDAVRSRLEELTRELTAMETSRIAAREALELAETRAAAARDARVERLSLVDRRENRWREVRAWFVEALAEPFERALLSLPVDATPVGPGAFDGDPHEAALAIARIGAPSAPLILVESPFETPVRARAALDAPVILARV